jgi:phospholipase/carboxylesterase
MIISEGLNMDTLQFVEVNTNKTPDSSVIWLHGLGADGHDFENLIADLRLPESVGIRFIFPHAPIQPVSINGGYPMRSWFDIYGLDKTSIQDEMGIRKSQQAIDRLIDQVIQSGIPSERIIIGGFSQGGALALHTALRFPKKLAGAVGLSTYLPLADSVATEAHTHNTTLPILLAHGTEDSIVPYHFGQISYQLLTNMGYSVTWHDYKMAHSVCHAEVQDISQWLQRVVS